MGNRLLLNRNLFGVVDLCIVFSRLISHYYDLDVILLMLRLSNQFYSDVWVLLVPFSRSYVMQRIHKLSNSSVRSKAMFERVNVPECESIYSQLSQIVRA